MKKVLILTVALAMSTLSWAATAKEDALDRLDKASDVLKEIMGAGDKGIPQEVLDKAKCVAVVPNMIKGGFVFGARNGKGVATCRLPSGGWSAPSFFAVSGGSWGAQIGVEGVDLVMTIMNEKGMTALLSNKVQLGGDASAAAGPIGRHVSANTDIKADTGILTYSRAKGLFAGATLNGAAIRQDDDSTKAVYGLSGEEAYKRILTGAVPPPPGARAFLATVRSAVSGTLAERQEQKKEAAKENAERVDDRDRAKQGMPQSDKPADTTSQPSGTETPKP
ncbi:MAG: lipid-binding SYLF domain-containing protein [Terriglobales bacterium]|jgi:SH3 domain-containing YSC84-like protein 1